MSYEVQYLHESQSPLALINKIIQLIVNYSYIKDHNILLLRYIYNIFNEF